MNPSAMNSSDAGVALVPSPAPSPKNTALTATASSVPLGPAQTVLVVDDSRAEQRLIAGLLGSLKLTVEVVDSGEAALEWLSQHVPDLMVVDVVMPGMSGFDLCRQLRSSPATEQVPIIFCTSKSQDFDRFWGLRQGGAAYLTKPFAPQELLDAVRSCLTPT